MPRALRGAGRGRDLHRHRQAGRAAHPHHRQVLAQHPDRGAARALPRPAAAGLPPPGPRDLGRAAGGARPAAELVPEAGLRPAARSRRATSRSATACPTPPTGVIDRPLKLLDTRTQHADGRGRRRSDGCRRPATRCCSASPDHALVAAAPETGRQHQIRVHLASIGHPIVGDKIYRASEQHFIDFCDGGHDRRAAGGLRRPAPPGAARAPPDLPPPPHRRSRSRSRARCPPT